ncbi:AbiH family protein [Gemella morbillorum]|uniref:AbiH family protein n=1 Tax=Gemella morbillorum TaxID=29391 RepID=UPI003567305C
MEQAKNLIIPDVLLVLGNGFDLQCELKSSYYDFLIYVLRNNNSNKEIEETKLLENYMNYIEYSLGVYNQYYKRNPEIEELNIWYLIFLYKKILMKKDWNFIENQILQEVLVDQRGLNIFSKVLFGILTRYILNENIDKNIILVCNGSEIKIFPNIYNVLSYNLYNKLDNNKENNIVYKNLFTELGVWKLEIEKKIASIVASDGYSNKKIRVDIIKEIELLNCIAEILLEQLKEIERDFIMYLDNEVNKNDDYEDNSKILVNYLLNHGKTSSKNINCNILSFNYTEPWGEKLNFRDDLLHVNMFKNIHGTIKNKSIIFGIDDNTIDANSEGYRFTKVSRIMEMNTVEENKSTPINVILDKSVNRVVFYGHSLSDADYGYFQFIFDEYVKNENLIFEFCYTVFEGTTKENEIIKLRDGISRLFGRYEKENNEKKYTIKNLNLNNRIKFREITKLLAEN